jgi:hypothetical protein
MIRAVVDTNIFIRALIRPQGTVGPIIPRLAREEYKLIYSRSSSNSLPLPMGLVTDYFVKLIERQVNEKGIVVWFDPERAYASLAATLPLPNTHVALLENSYFALRREADEWVKYHAAERRGFNGYTHFTG